MNQVNDKEKAAVRVHLWVILHLQCERSIIQHWTRTGTVCVIDWQRCFYGLCLKMTYFMYNRPILDYHSLSSPRNEHNDHILCQTLRQRWQRTGYFGSISSHSCRNPRWSTGRVRSRRTAYSHLGYSIVPHRRRCHDNRSRGRWLKSNVGTLQYDHVTPV